MSNKDKTRAPAPKQDVAVQETGSVPDYLKDKMQQGSGLKVDVKDLIIPRIKLLHGTSKEPETFNTAKVGNFWLNVVDQSLGASFRFIPISNRKRVLLMRPIDDKTGEPILARADDGRTWDRKGKWAVKLKGRKTADVEWEIDDLDVERSGLTKFGTADPEDGDSNPAATEFHEYLVMLPDFKQFGPVLLSLARTASKPARELNSKIELRGGPMQGMVFQAGIIKQLNDGGQEFYNNSFQSAGFADEADYNRCVAFAERYKSYRGADEEGERDNAGGKASAAAPKDRGEV